MLAEAVPTRRLTKIVLAVEGTILVALGVAGWLAADHGAFTGTPETFVLLWRVNPLFSALLAVTGVLVLLCAVLPHRLGMRVLGVVCTAYLGLFVYGGSRSAGGVDHTGFNLNAADNLLVLAVAMIGFVVVLGQPDSVLGGHRNG